MVHGGMPELFLGLAYNGTTGRLSVQVIKGSNFKNLAMSRAPGRLLFFVVSPNPLRSIHPSSLVFKFCYFSNL